MSKCSKIFFFIVGGGGGSIIIFKRPEVAIPLGWGGNMIFEQNLEFAFDGSRGDYMAQMGPNTLNIWGVIGQFHMKNFEQS